MRCSHTDIYLSAFYGTQVHLEVLMKKSFHKMLLDVVEKSPCFMFINYRDISLSWEGGKYNLLHHRTRNSSLGAVGSGLFVDSMCVFHFFFYREKKLGGRRIWDSIYGQDGKPTQMSGVKNSFSWQVKEVCSLGLADVFLSLALCYSWRAWLSAADILQTYLQVFFFSNLKILQYNRLERRET